MSQNLVLMWVKSRSCTDDPCGCLPAWDILLTLWHPLFCFLLPSPWAQHHCSFLYPFIPQFSSFLTSCCSSQGVLIFSQAMASWALSTEWELKQNPLPAPHHVCGGWGQWGGSCRQHSPQHICSVFQAARVHAGFFQRLLHRVDVIWIWQKCMNLAHECSFVKFQVRVINWISSWFLLQWHENLYLWKESKYFPIILFFQMPSNIFPQSYHFN